MQKRPIQHKETVILERLMVVELNKDLANCYGHIDKINHTSYAMNLNFTFLTDLPAIVVRIRHLRAEFRPESLCFQLKITVYALYSNEYRLMPIAIQRTVCDFLKNEFKWIEEELKCSHVPTECPIVKGDWYVRNYIPDIKRLPFISPWDNLKLRFHFFEEATSKMTGLIDLYLRVDRMGQIIKH